MCLLCIKLPPAPLASAGATVGARGELSLAEVQCHLDREGASDLVIDLIMNATSDRIFQESILLAIALLEGGNPVIQVLLLTALCYALTLSQRSGVYVLIEFASNLHATNLHFSL